MIGFIEVGIWFVAMGIIGLLSRRWTVEVRQKWYDHHPWWPRVDAWYEGAIILQFSLAVLACGIFLIIGSVILALL